MDSLPPFSWDQLSGPRHDQVDAQFTAVAAEFVNLRGEISKEVAGLSIKIGELDSKIKELDTSFSTKITEQTRIMVLMMAGFSLTVCGAMAGGVLFA